MTATRGPKADPVLVASIVEACRSAWTHWRGAEPQEQFYVFGLYTTPMAEFYYPVACGEKGLSGVAADLSAKGIVAGLIDEVRDSLRFVVSESPYLREGERFGDGVAAILGERPSPYGPPERLAEREIRIRHESAVEALKRLDAEGVFGTGPSRPLLLIEADDRESEFVLGFAKRLNPPAMFADFQRPYLVRPKGRFYAVGSKKVYRATKVTVALDPGVALVAAGSDDVFCFDVSGAKHEAAARAHARPVDGGALGTLLWRGPKSSALPTLKTVAVSADGRTFAGAFDQHEGAAGIAVWHDKTWRKLRRFPLAKGVVPLDIALAPDGTWLAVTSEDGHVRVLRVQDGIQLADLGKRKAWPRQVAISQDGTLLASADVKGGVTVWETSSWSERAHLHRPADHLAFTPDGGTVVTTVEFPAGRRDADEAPECQTALVWNLETGGLEHELRLPGWSISRAVPAPDGRSVACACSEIGGDLRHAAFLLDTQTQSVLDELSVDLEVLDLAFVCEGFVAVALYAHRRYPALVLWDIRK